MDEVRDEILQAVGVVVDPVDGVTEPPVVVERQGEFLEVLKKVSLQRQQNTLT